LQTAVIATKIRQLIASIDFLVREQLTVILEDSFFKDLLANWSCLHYLTEIAQSDYTQIKLLDLKWQEISSLIDFDNELDGGALAKTILDELDLPGNDPLSLIIGSYNLDVTNKDNVDILSHIAKISAYNFVPFITGVTPEIFDLKDFSQITRLNLAEIYKHKNFTHLTKLAEKIDSSFVGFTIPGVMIPSLISKAQNTNYCPVIGSNIKDYRTILGNGAYAFAAVIINSFINTGWFLDITGTPRGEDSDSEEGFGIVPNLKAESFFANDYPYISHIFLKYLTNFFISEHMEKELTDLGFIPICHVKDRHFAVFYSTNSLRNLHFKELHGKDFEIGSALQYMLCVCRFAHYIKIIGRQKLGLYSNISEFLNYLNNWLLQYISSDVETPLHLKHKYPLLDARVEVIEDAFLRNNYVCTIYLKPHLMSMQISADIVLKTKITTSNSKY
jgi:type VI secretion system protein ImpD